MRGERWLLRVGEFLVSRAAASLPAAVRDERRREWAAELPVILGDPEVKSAAARAGRMLWFAADTMRGTVLRDTALRPGRARHRGAHRGPVSKKGEIKVALVLVGVGAALLAAMAIMFALEAFAVYWVTFGVNQAYYVAFYVTFVVTYLAILAARFRWWRPSGADWLRWGSAGLVAAATGHLVSVLAGRLSWGHPLLFTLISDGGFAVCAACIGMRWVIVLRSDRQDRRPSSSS